MAKNYVQRGDTLTLTAPYDVASGAGLLVGAMFGVALVDALTGAEVEATTVGVYELPKLSTDVVTQGAKIYWDDANKECTVTAAGNSLIGAAVLAAGDGVATVKVRLNGVSV